MSSSFSTSSASSPVSSRTSRHAASAADSPASGWPLGRTSTSSRTRTTATKGRPRIRRTTTPPAENSRIIFVRHERNEAHGGHRLLVSLAHTDELLGSSPRNRTDERRAGRELGDQRRRGLVLGGSGHRDAAKRSAIRRSTGPVTDPH